MGSEKYQEQPSLPDKTGKIPGTSRDGQVPVNFGRIPRPPKESRNQFPNPKGLKPFLCSIGLVDYDQSSGKTIAMNIQDTDPELVMIHSWALYGFIDTMKLRSCRRAIPGRKSTRMKLLSHEWHGKYKVDYRIKSKSWNDRIVRLYSLMCDADSHQNSLLWQVFPK